MREVGATPYSQRGAKAIAWLATFGLPLYCAGNRGREVAFTFDDGPGPYTALALRILRRTHQQATFFVVGRNIKRYPGMLRREESLAVVGDHTWDHLDLLALPAARVRDQIRRTAQAEQRGTGRRTLLFRPPYAARNPRLDSIVRSLGLLQVLWDVDSRDWAGANPRQIARNVIGRLRPGDIVLFHENHGQTIKSLVHFVLPALKRLRLNSVSLETLLATDPPTPALLHAGYTGCQQRR
jgi:peptidoglycan-N-acetylglucosamine deacetylase